MTDQIEAMRSLLRKAERQLYQDADALRELNHPQNANAASITAEKITAFLLRGDA